MSMYIVDDKQRRNRPQPPCALRVPAGGARTAEEIEKLWQASIGIIRPLWGF